MKTLLCRCAFFVTAAGLVMGKSIVEVPKSPNQLVLNSRFISNSKFTISKTTRPPSTVAVDMPLPDPNSGQMPPLAVDMPLPDPNSPQMPPLAVDMPLPDPNSPQMPPLVQPGRDA